MEIMRIIWGADHKVTTKELRDKMPGRQLSTISTLTSRLIDKGVLRSEKKGRSHVQEYEAIITEAEYRQIQTREFVAAIHGGSAVSLMSALFRNDDLTKEDIAELKRLIEQKGV